MLKLDGEAKRRTGTRSDKAVRGSSPPGVHTDAFIPLRFQPRSLADPAASVSVISRSVCPQVLTEFRESIM